MLKLDELTHKYYYDNKPIKYSVSDIVKAFYPSNYPVNIPEQVLQRAANNGTIYHKMMDQYFHLARNKETLYCGKIGMEAPEKQIAWFNTTYAWIKGHLEKIINEPINWDALMSEFIAYSEKIILLALWTYCIKPRSKLSLLTEKPITPKLLQQKLNKVINYNYCYIVI